MFTSMQSMQIAHEIQADHRRRASSWRITRRARRVNPTAPVHPVRPIPSGVDVLPPIAVVRLAPLGAPARNVA